MIRSSLALLLAPLLMSACTQDITIPPGDDTIPSDPAPPDAGTWLSMGTAPDGQRLVISYYDRELGGLGFATGTPQADDTLSWYYEQVDGYGDPSTGLDSGDRGKYSSMKVAPDGTVWITYYDATFKTLRWAHRTGGPKSWVTGVVDAGPNVGSWCSLALDSTGKPVVSYHDDANGTLKLAKLNDGGNEIDGATWTAETIMTGTPFSGVDADGADISRPADVGTFSRLLIAGGTEFVAYYDAGQQRLGFASRTGAGAFTGGPISPEGTNMGQWPSILRDGETLYIAYHDVQNQNLMVSSGTPGGWVHEIADAGEFVGADTEVVKRGGNIGVVYFDGMNNDMKYVSKQGSVWVAETVGSKKEPVGFHNEIVKLGNFWWVASYDFATKSLFTKKLADE
jgi:hypothetical protein